MNKKVVLLIVAGVILFVSKKYIHSDVLSYDHMTDYPYEHAKNGLREQWKKIIEQAESDGNTDKLEEHLNNGLDPNFDDQYPLRLVLEKIRTYENAGRNAPDILYAVYDMLDMFMAQ